MDIEDDLPQKLSRTAKKNAMRAVHVLARDLVEMPAGDFKAIDLDPVIREEVEKARRITSHVARRRHLRFLTKLIAESDLEGVEQAMKNLQHGKRANAANFQALETHRESLLTGGREAVDRIMEIFPNGNRAELERLQRNGQQERLKGGAVTAARAIFRYLRKLSEETLPDESSETVG